MLGDELVSLLSGYVSELQKVALQFEARSAAHSISIEDTLGRAVLAGSRDRQVDQWANEIVSQSHRVSGDGEDVGVFGRLAWIEHTTATPGSTDLGGRPWSDFTRAIAGQEATVRTGDGALGSALLSPALTALLDVFGKIGGINEWDAYEHPRYAPGLPSYPVEGISGEGGRLTGLDSSYDGLPRRMERGQQGVSRIDVRIEALDARSFLDRKEDIAEAVRQAMLTSGVMGGALSDY